MGSGNPGRGALRNGRCPHPGQTNNRGTSHGVRVLANSDKKLEDPSELERGRSAIACIGIAIRLAKIVAELRQTVSYRPPEGLLEAEMFLFFLLQADFGFVCFV